LWRYTTFVNITQAWLKSENSNGLLHEEQHVSLCFGVLSSTEHIQSLTALFCTARWGFVSFQPLMIVVINFLSNLGILILTWTQEKLLVAMA
jgi:hypothetical protein